jgi:dCTP deaminase
MILSDRDIRKLLVDGVLIIDPLKDSQIGPTSVDLHLGDLLVKYDTDQIVLGKSLPESVEIQIDPVEGYTIKPFEFILGCTLEKIRMPNGYQGFIETKGDVARAGLQIHNGDGHVDPGTDHILTLEITNLNSIPIILYPQILVCQLFIHILTSDCNYEYRGKYFGQTKPTTYRPI